LNILLKVIKKPSKISKRIYINLGLEVIYYSFLLWINFGFEDKISHNDKVLLYSILTYAFMKLFIVSFLDDDKKQLLRLNTLLSFFQIFISILIFKELLFTINSFILFSFPFCSLAIYWVLSTLKGSNIHLLLGFLSLLDTNKNNENVGIYDLLFSALLFSLLVGYLIIYFRI